MFGLLELYYRNCYNIYALHIVYCSFIGLSLKHSLIIYSPYILKHNLSSKTVQNKCLSFLCHRRCIPRIPHTSYDTMLSILSSDSLNLR